jgi:glycosyltransferase involved in cell wall biosynthesis
MKIAVLFDAQTKWGGSYQMSINNLLEIKDLAKKNNIELVVISHKKNSILDILKIDYEIIRFSAFDYLFLFFQKSFIFKLIINKFKILSIFEKKLIKNNIKFIVFLFTSYKALLLQKINFASTVLDTCHRDFPEFSESKSFQKFYFREYLNKNLLPLSSIIIVESEELKKKIIYFYQLNDDRIISIPNLPSKLLLDSQNIVNVNKVKEKYNLVDNFFFYPAQFWFHKNHLIILKALKKLNEKKKNIHFVFCGSNQGSLDFVKKKIDQYNINEYVKIFDYLPDDEVLALYKLSAGLVMPTYFGPTNIPPLEAWYLNIPVIYSSNLKNHGGDAALYFNPDSEEELIESLTKLEDQKIKEKLIFNGQKRIKELNIQRTNSLDLLLLRLKKLEKIIY